jgi:hypothetical protein
MSIKMVDPDCLKTGSWYMEIVEVIGVYNFNMLEQGAMDLI